MRVRKAVIPVAGLGTRLLPATKAIPKELVPVVRKPAIQWVVESAVAAGIEQVILVTSAGKSAIEDHFDRHLVLERTLSERGKDDLAADVIAAAEIARVISVRQAEPLGLGHAVLQARDAVGDEPFAVLLPDELVMSTTPPLAQCMEAAVDGAPVVGLARVAASEVSRYGIVDPAPHGEGTCVIRDLIEKPSPDEAPSNLAITGPYVLVPAVFEALERVQPGSGGEIQLTDALRTLTSHAPPLLGRIVDGERLDVGTALGFLQANVAMGLADEQLGADLRRWLESRLER